MSSRSKISYFSVIRRFWNWPILFVTFLVIILNGYAVADPLSKMSVEHLLKQYNKNEVSKEKLEFELKKWGMAFQLTDDVSYEFSELMSLKEKRGILDYIKGASKNHFFSLWIP